MTFLEQKIRDAHTAGRTALIPFVTAGFPTLDTFWGIIEELDANGADVIEIGVPFSDPVADGPVVEDASRRALEQGVSRTGSWTASSSAPGTSRRASCSWATSIRSSSTAGTLRRRCRTSGRLRLHRAGSAA